MIDKNSPWQNPTTIEKNKRAYMPDTIKEEEEKKVI